ncbi:MAG TPA: exosortase/archaeosortase family protein [Kiritimatiellae bacterium]|nr:exosortase/archaeosortase family protein [Kiritimatiellia bacterium]
MDHRIGVWHERLGLTALGRREVVHAALVAVIVALIFSIFHFQGNTTDVRAFGRSALVWMVRRWTESTGDFSHGWLIPFVSMAVVWLRRRDLAAVPKKVSWVGTVVVCGALLLHWLGAKSQQTRLSLMGLILLIWGIPFYLFGWELAKRLIFPCAYLIYCIPLNFLDSITFPLRIFMAAVTTLLLNGMGIAAERSGSAIYSLAGGGFSFDVADPCSGLRSLLAMTALTAVYANFTQKTLVKKWILFLAAIPIAVAGNVARVTTVALVAEAFGEKPALGLYHDYSGYVVFAVGILLMVSAGYLLNVDFREAFERWKQMHTGRTS